MMLFKPEHVSKILNGEKTQTRRIWKKNRALVGAIHQARTELFGKPFAYLKILSVHKELLIQISEEDVVKEGFNSFLCFVGKWEEINGVWDDCQEVYVIEFVLSAYNEKKVIL